MYGTREMSRGRRELFFVQSFHRLFETFQPLFGLSLLRRYRFGLARGTALLASVELFPHLVIVFLPAFLRLECFVRVGDRGERDLYPSKLCCLFAMETIGMEKLCHREIRILDFGEFSIVGNTQD